MPGSLHAGGQRFVQRVVIMPGAGVGGQSGGGVDHHRVLDRPSLPGQHAPSDAAVIRVDGTIQELECNYYFNRDAHALLQLNLVDLRSNAIVYSQSQRTDNSEGGVGAGIFGDVNHLAEFMQKTLNQTIDKFFADPPLASVFANASAAPDRSK